ncbi:PAS domain-containing hybrid sensor histidine kinase/response regulator [Falsiroseomonas oryzae]|uniref:PAS domain-containing hybrid sensor histidine kinase/response regulator n=1 Tax=Falsiroseomonas oryzae TaxID=2766473 RepID=UPI0022EA1D4B|nr:PAS domain-containing hybrid sensor histidine kinase/response regulator [Roseomonas sp. MO-31]
MSTQGDGSAGARDPEAQDHTRDPAGGPSASFTRALEARLAERDTELECLRWRLRDCEERILVAQRFAGAALWAWDIAQDRLDWSDACTALHGLDVREAASGQRGWLDSVHPEDRPGTQAVWQDFLRDRAVECHLEFRILHPERGERWLARHARLACDDAGMPTRMTGIDIDITDRKRAEAALAASEDIRRELEQETRMREQAQAREFQTLKLEALGQLTGGVAHDFNNLLSVVMSGAALLRKDQDAIRRGRLMDAIEQAARRGADLTRRLLTFARRQALHPAPLDLRAWLAEMHALLAGSLPGGIAIAIEAHDDLWPVLVDAGELELALLNLAANARDAMPDGGMLRLAAANAALDPLADPDGLGGDFVRLTLADSGKGMPAEVLAHAFEPFFSTKAVGRGSGLGLAQVYGFARQSGGAARIASIPGHGTAVTLLLPRATRGGAATLPAGNPVPDGQPGSDGAALHILLVEDDDDVAALTMEMLRHLGHIVARVATGPAALAALADGTPADLVLTDVLMPGGQDGFDLARCLAAERPSLPVLLCSGYGGAPPRVAAARLPLLRKPFTLGDLRRALLQAQAARGAGQARAAQRDAPPPAR